MIFTTHTTDQKAHISALKIAPVQANDRVRPIELTEQAAIQVADKICSDISLCPRKCCLAFGHTLKYRGIDQSQ